MAFGSRHQVVTSTAQHLSLGSGEPVASCFYCCSAVDGSSRWQPLYCRLFVLALGQMHVRNQSQRTLRSLQTASFLPALLPEQITWVATLQPIVKASVVLHCTALEACRLRSYPSGMYPCFISEMRQATGWVVLAAPAPFTLSVHDGQSCSALRYCF